MPQVQAGQHRSGCWGCRDKRGQLQHPPGDTHHLRVNPGCTGTDMLGAGGGQQEQVRDIKELLGLALDT